MKTLLRALMGFTAIALLGCGAPSRPSVDPLTAPRSVSSGAPASSATLPPPAITTAHPAAAAPSHAMPPLAPSQYTAELAALGITKDKVPLWNEMPHMTKKKVMGLMKQSLGFEKCSGCHAEDVSKVTRNMKVAKKMWDTFVAPLRQTDGSLVFCDSCHHGTTDVLVRSSHDALVSFMKAEYTQRIAKADGSRHGCASCHGDPFQEDIVEKAWGIPE